jgi:hypothetical protein
MALLSINERHMYVHKFLSMLAWMFVLVCASKRIREMKIMIAIKSMKYTITYRNGAHTYT